MPELPEVETIARRLRDVVVGKKIQKITVQRDKSFVGSPATLEGAAITGISRRSKVIQFDFDVPEKLLVHLKMTGQLIYQDPKIRLGGGHPSADWVAQLPNKYTRVVVELSDAATLFFNDLRVFGWLKVLDEAQVLKEFSTLGPDIIDPLVTEEYFYQKLQKRGLPVKLVLMDNAVAAGVGNIYANDALNLAQLNPFRPANSLSKEESNRLLIAAKAVITSGIELGGATIDNFRDIDGFAGQYQNVVRTYGKTGLPCPNCGHAIIREKQAGRSTFYCPNCQK